MTVAYPGEEGAYAAEAGGRLYPDAELVAAAARFADVVRAVTRGEAARGVLPIENSLAGAVPETYDLLAHAPLSIVDEAVLPVPHVLVGLAGANIDALTRIHSHPMALTQCRRFLSSLPDTLPEVAPSTAGRRAPGGGGRRPPPGRHLLPPGRRAARPVGAPERRLRSCPELHPVRCGRPPYPASTATAAPGGSRCGSSPTTTRGRCTTRSSRWAATASTCARCSRGRSPGRPWNYQFYVDLEGHPLDRTRPRRCASSSRRGGAVLPGLLPGLRRGRDRPLGERAGAGPAARRRAARAPRDDAGREGARRRCRPASTRRCASGSRAAGIDRLYTPPGGDVGGGAGRRRHGRHRHRQRQVAGLQPAGARRGWRRDAPRRAALPVSDQGAGPGSGPGAARAGRAGRAGGHLRRRHSRPRATAGARLGEPGADQPRHAARRHPARRTPPGRDLFAKLRYVVVDEAHAYRGVFGSHVANVLARLRRLADRYGAEPRFLLASATVANPGEARRRRWPGGPVEVIDEDGSPAPPSARSRSGTRRCWTPTSASAPARWARRRRCWWDWWPAGQRTIVFAKSRAGMRADPPLRARGTAAATRPSWPAGSRPTVPGTRPSSGGRSSGGLAGGRTAGRGRHQRARAGGRHRPAGLRDHGRFPGRHRLAPPAVGPSRAPGPGPGDAGGRRGPARPVLRPSHRRAAGAPARGGRQQSRQSGRAGRAPALRRRRAAADRGRRSGTSARRAWSWPSTLPELVRTPAGLAYRGADHPPRPGGAALGLARCGGGDRGGHGHAARAVDDSARADSTAARGRGVPAPGRAVPGRALDPIARVALVEPFTGDFYTQPKRLSATAIQERAAERRDGPAPRLRLRRGSRCASR